MILKGNVTVSNTLTGSISPAELLGFIRQTVNIPEGADVTLHVNVGGDRFFVDEDMPLEFTAIWSSATDGEAHEVPAKVVTTVPPATPQHEPS